MIINNKANIVFLIKIIVTRKEKSNLSLFDQSNNMLDTIHPNI